MNIPHHLTDVQLVDALKRCARDERHATALLVAHLAEMDARHIHLRAGFPSLFVYCCEVLRLSESATYKRIEVARAVRKHPTILERLAAGALNLTTARLLAPHLTAENCAELLAAARGLGKRAVEELLARRFPRPDVAALVRKLPVRIAPEPCEAPRPTTAETPPAGCESASNDADASAPPLPTLAVSVQAPAAHSPAAHSPTSMASGPLAVPLSADRYQIRFTASASTWEKLRVARDLLRHAVPNGDPGEIVDRALTALIEELAKRKCAAVKTTGQHRRTAGRECTAAGSRHVPAHVRRAVWVRDQGRCAYMGEKRRRCATRGFLEFHHVEPYAVGGSATVANIQLRCRAHNAYESVLFFGGRERVARIESSGDHVRAAAKAPRSLSPRDSTGPGASCPISAEIRAPGAPCLRSASARST